MKIAFLGLGAMGSQVASHLTASGDELTVWNRSGRKATEFAARYPAHAASSPAEAVQQADVVFSMLMDDAATSDALLSSGALDAMKPGATHLTLSTLSVDFVRSLTAEHRKRRLGYIGCPVFGRPNVAAQAQLYLVAGGETARIETVRPLLSKIGRAVRIVSNEPAVAHACKLAGNFLIAHTIAGLTEGAIAGSALGIDPAVFFEVVNDALFRSPFIQAYGALLLQAPDSPGASLAVGEKDTRLFGAAAKAQGVETPFAQIVHDRLQIAIDRRGREADWPSGYYATSRELDHK